MKKVKSVFVKVVLLILALLMISCSGQTTPSETPQESQQQSPSQKQVFFSSGTPGGVYQMLGAGMARIINEQTEGFELVAMNPAQMAQAPAMLQSGEVSLSIGMACMFERAYAGVDEFENGPPMDQLVQVAGMYDNVYGITALAGSPLETIEDITEETIIGSTATNYITAQALVNVVGKYDPNKIDYRTMSYAQAIEALGDGNTDMSILTAFPYNGNLDSLVVTKGVKFLTMPEDIRLKFDQMYPRWKTQILPANTYEGQTEDIYGPTIYTVLYARKDVPDEVIYNIIKACIENVDELALIHPSGQYFTNETTKRYLEEGIMELERMHPGAVKFFQDVGVIE
jgi:TRAP transporter TAXI family solute receptor